MENPHGQRSLENYSPWCHKELDMTNHTITLAEQRFPSSSTNAVLERGKALNLESADSSSNSALKHSDLWKIIKLPWVQSAHLSDEDRKKVFFMIWLDTWASGLENFKFWVCKALYKCYSEVVFEIQSYMDLSFPPGFAVNSLQCAAVSSSSLFSSISSLVLYHFPSALSGFSF